MLTEFADYYPWVKALHVVCVIVWVGPQLVMGLLIHSLSRLSRDGSDTQAELRLRIDFLIGCLMNLAMLGAFLLGALMASSFWVTAGTLPLWLWLKIGLVFALSTLHGLLYRQYRQANRGQLIWSGQCFGMLQTLGLGTVLGIVILVIIKPVAHG